MNDFVRPEAQNAPTFAFHCSGATRIGFHFERVMVTINLDNKFSRDTGEVREIPTDWVLSAELDAAYAAIPQEVPADTLGATAVTAVACAWGGAIVTVGNVV